MKKEGSEMYVSVFERVYTEKGKLDGIQEVARKMLAKKMPFDVIITLIGPDKYLAGTGLWREHHICVFHGQFDI
jgi:hypothetical protein